jgi:hypothetical protein
MFKIPGIGGRPFLDQQSSIINMFSSFSKNKTSPPPNLLEGDQKDNNSINTLSQTPLHGLKASRAMQSKEEILSIVDPHETLRKQLSPSTPAYFIPSYIDEELRLKDLRYFLSPSSTKERLLFEVFENEKYLPITKQWGKVEGVYLNRLTDRAPYTYVDPSLDNRSIK